LDTPPVIVDAPVFQFLCRRTGEAEQGRRHKEHESGCGHQPAYHTGFRREGGEAPCPVGFSTRGARSAYFRYVEHPEAPRGAERVLSVRRAPRGEKTLLGAVYRRPQQEAGEICGLAMTTSRSATDPDDGFDLMAIGALYPVGVRTVRE